MGVRPWAACVLVILVGLAPARGRFGGAVREGSQTQAVGPVKLALLIGINEYAAPSLPRLGGPVNDVLSMRQVLQDFYAFEPDNILTLTNGAATREAILGGFRKHLTENARKNPGAVIYIHFGGMGATTRDLNGDEADGLDEAIVPYDARPGGINYVTDDELDGLLGELSTYTRNVTLVYDTCYGFDESGGRQRLNIRGGAHERTPANADAVPAPTNSPTRPVKNGFVVITASLPGQTALDPSPLTFNLLRELRRTPVATYRDLMRRVATAMSHDVGHQIPQVDGDIDRLFLGGLGRTFEVKASASSPTQITLQGGYRQGLSEGVRVAVYKPHAKSLAGYKDRLAEGVVVSATENSAVAEVGVKVAIPAGASAVVSPPRDPEQIHIALDKTSLPALANIEAVVRQALAKAKVTNDYSIERLLNSSGSVVVGETDLKTGSRAADGSWDVALASGKFGAVFREMRAQLEAVSRGNGTHLPPDDREVLYMVGADGRPLFGFFADPTSPGSAMSLRRAIDGVWSQRFARSFYVEGSPLNGALEVYVTHVEGEVKVTGLFKFDGERPALADEGAGATFRLAYGDLFRVRVRNRSSKTLYLTVVNLRPDGEVREYGPSSLLSPTLDPGETFVSPVLRATGIPGEDVFKFIASTSSVTYPFSPMLSTDIDAFVEARESGSPELGTTQVRLLVAAPVRASVYPQERAVEFINKSLHIIAIGINKHQDPYRQLRFSVQDARDITAVLSERAGEMYNVRAHLLLDEQATRAGIEAAFKAVAREAKPEDTFIFYNSTYDYTDRALYENMFKARKENNELFLSPYLLPNDESDPKDDWFILPQDVIPDEDPKSDWRKNAISAELLRDWVLGIRARNQLLVFDSSRASLGRFVVSLGNDRKFANTLLRKNLVVFGGNGTEFTDAGHGEFTLHLLGALSGEAYSGMTRNQITARDVQHFLRGKVSHLRSGPLFQSFSVGDDFALGGVPKALAEKTRDADADTDFPEPQLVRVKRTGKDYALLIATDDYGENSGLGDLPNPVRDAEAVARVLRDNYGFEVEVLANKSKREIEQVIESNYLDLGKGDDQLFVFFAGHGSYKERLGDGGVAVGDSAADDINTYLRFDWIKSRLDRFSFRHILVVVDVCYSGAFFKSVLMKDRTQANRAKMTDADFYAERIKFSTRKALASSALKPVFDGRPGANSPFTTELLSALRRSGEKELITFDDLKIAVDRVKPGPVGGDFGGEAGSDFFFVPKRNPAPAGLER
ncbi:MAG TPA: caspase family protein [Pyrinomonadaceae bacterium]